MAEVLATASAVVGLVVPALHGVRLLTDDVRSIANAPKLIRGLESDLGQIQATLESLGAIKEERLAELEQPVCEKLKIAIRTCAKICDDSRGDLKRWTRKSRNGELSWRGKVDIGFFKERQVQAMREQLRNCNRILMCPISVAALYSSLNNNIITKAVMDKLSAEQASISALSRSTDAQLATTQGQIKDLQLKDTVVHANNDEDEEELEGALGATESAAAVIRSLREMIRETAVMVRREKVEEMIAKRQSVSTSVTFGHNNQGFQVGQNMGSISGVNIGRMDRY